LPLSPSYLPPLLPTVPYPFTSIHIHAFPPASHIPLPAPRHTRQSSQSPGQARPGRTANPSKPEGHTGFSLFFPSLQTTHPIRRITSGFALVQVCAQAVPGLEIEEGSPINSPGEPFTFDTIAISGHHQRQRQQKSCNGTRPLSKPELIGATTEEAPINCAPKVQVRKPQGSPDFPLPAALLLCAPAAGKRQDRRMKQTGKESPLVCHPEVFWTNYASCTRRLFCIHYSTPTSKASLIPQNFILRTIQHHPYPFHPPGTTNLRVSAGTCS
jgi:hypothetical protein